MKLFFTPESSKPTCWLLITVVFNTSLFYKTCRWSKYNTYPLKRKLFWVFVFHFGTQEGCSAYSALLSMAMITASLWRFSIHEKHLWFLVSENTGKLYCPVNVDIRSKILGKRLFVIQSIPEHLPWANSCWSCWFLRVWWQCGQLCVSVGPQT